MRIAPAITLTEEQARQLQAWARGRSVEVRLAQRAQMILLAAQGMTDQAIAAELQVGRRTPARWRQRFLEHGPVGIERDAPRSGRKRQISAAKVRQVIAKTTRENPPRPRTGARARWRRGGHQRSERAADLARTRPQAALGEAFKVSNDPALRRETGGRRGAVSEPAGARAGAVRRREKPDPGAGPHAARAAAEEGPLRDDDARLQAQRHDDAVRGPEVRWRAR